MADMEFRRARIVIDRSTVNAEITAHFPDQGCMPPPFKYHSFPLRACRSYV
jgi:hypothetical protein